MAEIRVPRNETEVPLTLHITNQGPVTGATAVVAIRDADTDDSYLDFSDSTFKTAGHTTIQAALTELATSPGGGVYALSGGLDLTALTNLPAATDHLEVEYEVTAPASSVGTAQDQIYIDDRVEDLNDLSQAQILLDATPFAGANIDATISSRNSVTPMTAALSQTEHDATQAAIAALPAAPSVASIVAGVWGEALPGAFLITEAGGILGTRVDTTVSSRSSHSAADVDTVLTAAHGAGAWTTGSAPTAAAIATAVWGEALPGVFGSGTAGNILGPLRDRLLGRKDIDFTGDDSLGWQRVYFDEATGVTELQRDDLFEDEGYSRIKRTVVEFIVGRHILSREQPS